MNKKNENILITGGSRGLGLEYARYLASQGYNVGITDISDSACCVYGEAVSIEDILTELSDYGVETWFEAADLNDPLQTDEMVSSFVKKFGKIHAVITNAGGDISGDDSSASGGKAESNTFFVSYDEYKNIFKRNFDTTMNTLRSVVPYMKTQGYGKVVTVSSINAVFGVEKETTYSIAKAAILQLTRSLAAEVRKDGINVNCIIPGPVKTGRFMATLKDRHPHDLEMLEKKSRLERVALPQDITPLVGFLVSPGANYISGSVIKIDGGLLNHVM